jgi:GMP synthase-like glutamine amidotransferase
MSKQVLIFLHMDDEYPGYIADFLHMREIPFHIIRPYAGDVIPQWHADMAGLVFMGGVMSANDDIPWIKQEIALIQSALMHDTPLLGHCLGGQLISKALGASVTDNPVGEVGWHYCTKTTNESVSEWLGGIDEKFIMFHWHFQTFSIPENAQLLFSSEYCQNQAYCYGDNVLAMQGHVEMTKDLLSDWITKWRDDLKLTSPSIQNYDQVRESLEDNISALNKVAERLYQRWLMKLSIST